MMADEKPSGPRRLNKASMPQPVVKQQDTKGQKTISETAISVKEREADSADSVMESRRQ